MAGVGVGAMSKGAEAFRGVLFVWRWGLAGVVVVVWSCRGQMVRA